MSFKNLKKSRSDAINKLREAAEKAQGGSQNENNQEEFWKPTRDKAGNGYAVIRFLPAPEGEELPWVRYWDHGFQGPGGQWYIEKSLTTLGQDDPVSELNSELWNSGHDEDKETARAQKRRLHYVANILVITDKDNKENEGKVFQYKFGKKIFDKIMDAMQPEFDDEDPMNPFDFWDGADFKIKVRKVDGWVNYDKSEFDKPSALFDGDDAKLEEIYNQLKPLQTFVDPSTFKSYSELKARLVKVLGTAAVGPATAEAAALEKTAEAKPMKEVSEPKYDSVDDSDEDSDEDIMDHFRKLANS